MKNLDIRLPGTPEKEGTTTIPVKKSGGRGTLNLHDAIKGLIIAAIVGGGTIVYQSVQDWVNELPWNLDLLAVAREAVKAGIAYLTVNFFSKAKVVINAKDLLK